ncbi:MAG: uroporphyrinogen decarboxylase family protein [Candidatus Ratteibacteria bacterium]|jgi:uroporphyrinogen decarboxylase
MTYRERVLTVFKHSEPDCVPAWLGASPEFRELAIRHLGLNDDESLSVRLGDHFRRVFAGYAGPEHAGPLSNLQRGATYRSPFGVERHGYGYGQPLSHPLSNATSVSEIDRYPWPDPGWIDPSNIRNEALKHNGQYAILGGDWSPFWHDAIDLLGMENLLIKMFDQPELVDTVMGHIVDYYAGANQRIFEAAAGQIDILFIGNDFGTQSGPIVGEDLFRRFILPHLKRLVNLGHDYGLKVLLHCCGGFLPLIPAMIEIGLDGLQSLQPSCSGMEPAGLKAAFGGKIVFNGCIDTQHVLIEGTPDLVRTKTREIMSIMKPGGGYIASPSHDYLLPGTPVENVVAMFDAVREYGSYG